MPRVFCKGLERAVELAEGLDLLRGLQAAGVPIASSCGGDGICGQCAVWVSGPQGPVEALEARTRTRQGVPAEQRLACCVQSQEGQQVHASYWGVPKT